MLHVCLQPQDQKQDRVVHLILLYNALSMHVVCVKTHSYSSATHTPKRMRICEKGSSTHEARERSRDFTLYVACFWHGTSLHKVAALH